MNDSKLPNDASASIGAIIYQLYVALDKCFELEPGESVYVEKFGDVSNSDEQIEVKQYSDSLTDAHPNFWNTVKNWMSEDFEHTKFKYLILLTTQDLGSNTRFASWNGATIDERLTILTQIKDDATKRYSNALEKDKKKEKPQSLKLMEQVMDPTSASRLKDILPKVIIADASPLPQAYYDRIKNRYLKGIPTVNKEVVMQSALGLIINPEIIDGNFEIKEEVFSKQFEEITAQYNSTTIIFPKKHLTLTIDEGEKNKHLAENYIKKILEIEYEEVITDAVTHYVIANRTIAEEFLDRLSSKPIYDAYHQEIINQIKPMYSIASRNAKADTLIDQSKTHYDEIMRMPSPALGNFNDTHILFKNGTIHSLANEESSNIRWKLKLKDE